jgi:hypothetical protein
MFNHVRFGAGRPKLDTGFSKGLRQS